MIFNWFSSDILYQFELALKSSHRQWKSVFENDFDNQYQFQNTLHNYGTLDTSRLENTLHNYGLVDIDNQYQFQNTLHNYESLDMSRENQNTLHNHGTDHA